MVESFENGWLAMFNKLSRNQVGQYILGGPQALRILLFSQAQLS
jgi:hypothetical protein